MVFVENEGFLSLMAFFQEEHRTTITARLEELYDNFHFLTWILSKKLPYKFVKKEK